MADITFEITKSLGVLSESAKGWTKELNLVSWNDWGHRSFSSVVSRTSRSAGLQPVALYRGREPKYDIREWDPAHEKMGKGLTLTEEELIALKALLEKLI